MAETANIEIVEPFVKLGINGDEGSINLDQERARSLYAMAWERFEKALIAANAIYNEDVTEQPYQHNRVKRLLWEATDLKQAIEVIYYMTALPEDDESADEA